MTFSANLSDFEQNSNAIRMTILCNPTDNEGAFRAIDWVVEHNNLYTKRIYSGKYSNHTKERMISQSPLIEVHKNIRIQFETMFCLEHKTTRHSPPKMEKTFAKLKGYIDQNNGFTYTTGRKSHYTIPDVISRGLEMVQTGRAGGDGPGHGETECGDAEEIEVADDGSLDV